MTSLRSLTVPLGDLSAPAGLLDYLVRDDALCWMRRGGGMLGFGEVTRFTARGADRFDAARRWWEAQMARADVVNHVGLPGTGPMAFGSFTFSADSAHESRLIVPELVLGTQPAAAGEPAGGWLTILTADPDVDLSPAAAEAALARYLDDASAERDTDPADRLAPGTLSETQWQAAVAEAVNRIRGGQLRKLVLARDVVARLHSPVAVAQVLRELAVRYRDCWTYSVDGLIGSTPEMLIKVEGTTARARVLAGTLDRLGAAKPDGETDTAYALRVLAGSGKQQHEHELAIDSLTRRLAPFTTTMSSHSEPFVLELPNVWHLASDVSAELSPDGVGSVPSSLELAAALHPTAAVCGTPTSAAQGLIAELEEMDRGPYAGPVGWVDAAGNGEWGIALRGAVIEDPRTVRLFAGCGIVEGSRPEAELAETWSKFRPMMEALGLRR